MALPYYQNSKRKPTRATPPLTYILLVCTLFIIVVLMRRPDSTATVTEITDANADVMKGTYLSTWANPKISPNSLKLIAKSTTAEVFAMSKPVYDEVKLKARTERLIEASKEFDDGDGVLTSHVTPPPQTQTQTQSSESKLPIRIIVIQSSPEHYWCSCAKTITSNYASRHNYELSWIETWNDPSYDKLGPTEAKMSKYSTALKYMGSSSLIMIMDCDIFITTPTIKIEDIWQRWSYPSTSVIISRDAEFARGVPINSGMILIKPSLYVTTTLASILKKGRIKPGTGFLDRWFGTGMYNSKTLVDQPRLTLELQITGQLDVANNVISTEYNEYVTVVSQRVMNSFYRFGYNNDSVESIWVQGDFVAHVTGMPSQERGEAARLFGMGCKGIVEKKGVKLTTDGKNVV